MKKILITFVFLLTITETILPQANPTKVFIQMNSFDDKGGTRATTIMQVLDGSIYKRIKKDYPCLDIFDSDGLSAILSWERQRQLLGGEGELSLQEIGSALGCKYLIALNIKILNDQAQISAIFMDNTKAKTLSRVFETAPYGEPAIDAAEKVANNLFDDLKTYEICPFKGDITVYRK